MRLHPINKNTVTDNTLEGININYVEMKVENLKASIWTILYWELFKDLKVENPLIIRDNANQMVEFFDGEEFIGKIKEDEFYKYYSIK